MRERTQAIRGGCGDSGVLDPESNVQFGEGGAGTFSDGKLWSQIKDPRHLGRKVLTEFVAAGAPPEILTEAHPHIGTFRLVTMVESMRATIEALGGEYRFGAARGGLDLADTGPARGRACVGCTFTTAATCRRAGWSSRSATARATRSRCCTISGVHVEAKPFSIGVRIEHPQSWIDRARFGACAGHPDLGAAAYTLSHHCTQRSARSTASACARAGGWWRRRRRRVASPRTA